MLVPTSKISTEFNLPPVLLLYPAMAKTKVFVSITTFSHARNSLPVFNAGPSSILSSMTLIMNVFVTDSYGFALSPPISMKAEKVNS